MRPRLDQDVEISARAWSTAAGAQRLRSVFVAAAVAVALVLVAGAAMVVQAGFALRRFGGQDYVPRVVSLQVARTWGAWAATIATCLVVTAVLHETILRAKDDREPPPAHLALLSAVAVPLLYVPVSLLALGGAFVTARVHLDVAVAPRDFVEAIEAGDVLNGSLYALALAALPALWARFGSKVLRLTSRGLGFRLLMTWLVLLGLSTLTSVVAAIMRV
jgi:ABC-type transporter Mla maintaining outer membrane lipid asymmetry permease subunit MlaE